MKNRNTKPELTTLGKLIVGSVIILGWTAVIFSILVIIKVFVDYIAG